MPLGRYRGVFEPEDLDLLQRVLDKLCGERGIDRDDSDQREVLAWGVILLFQNGITDEAELLQACRLR
ncbi:hypothetical protein ACYG9R_09110 [Mesorhizobium sp. RSR565B]|uniref:hypothetical protein n=1 Tax=Mesorhizobium sp. L103C565B0 TaxID=1287094 RepID=UPI0003CFC169|nr:hypothetical protein [Mesorhizobium sp. L103C565B0]ESZ50440.1 hypothetical protein X730_11965 [Mesorhizobium sp. L103C565B0]